MFESVAVDVANRLNVPYTNMAEKCQRYIHSRLEITPEQLNECFPVNFAVKQLVIVRTLNEHLYDYPMSSKFEITKTFFHE